MTAEQARLRAAITDRRGAVRGPFEALLRSPVPGGLLEELSTYCARESALPERLRELALLVVARRFDAQHSWLAHVGKAVAAGVDPAALERLARDEPPGFGRADEAVLHRFAVQALTDHFVDDDTYAAALAEFGEQGLVDLVIALGTFTTLALVLNTFQVDLPPDREPPFPDVRGFRREDQPLPAPGEPLTAPTRQVPLPSRRLRAGVTRTDITPADLTGLHPMPGSFSAVHDPLFLRALYLDDGETEVALVSLDLIEAGDITPLRERIERELGIPADHVVITATHTHNAPRIADVSPGALAHAGGPESFAYTEIVYDRVVAALREARSGARPARFGVGSGTADVNVNREEYADGRWILGHNPDGPSDKTVWVLKFESEDGEPIAVLINYAVHSTVVFGTGEISGDLAGAACRHVERALREEHGTDTVALWMPGALGDQAPRIDLGLPFGVAPTERQRARAYAAMDAQGLIVGTEVLRVADRIGETSSGVRIRAGQRTIPCPVKAGHGVMETMRQETVDTVPLRLALVALGDVALTGVSGEVITEVHRRLRAESPLARTLLVSLANDRIGYLPDDAHFDRPVHSVNGCPIARGHAENAIVDGLVGLITDLVSGGRG
ncbi:neutral/alkaline non-lysosomal ceramidase N-terminal domain-containing protein [Streptomyces cylindrosporus]|uniref:Neutral/alkaline non-lysosomal ceramidase N-terminal domain-containing protein n=1 Tax=Streptomyces cylindrosporus TaxID=2927583 RepID=A0ABS9YPW7_9ACTN|nr:neutral/alkaline non-lysosomal ceramidase N-terminal domain-containing protein [Streptomyces cylindrosporus]MCI3278894.1 neutral/alkaline non-lysosomal ceramidase N-terminal domain-containing protein [Streptomyces cylindrosporus]